jgi:hypothetical protein
MKSAIASLRSLTLPFGATEGSRIVLDGINGEIRIYDSNDDLLMKLDNEGLQIFDGDGNLRMWLAIPGGLNAAYSIMEWYTTREDQSLPGFISVYDTAARNRMVISPGENGRGNMEWTLMPEDADILKEAMIQAVCYTLDHANNLRPTIDLTGASSQAGKEPYTVVYDLWYGTPNSFGSTPTFLKSAGRGQVGFQTNSNDVVVPTVVGDAVTLVGVGNIDVIAGRRYKVLMAGGHSLLSGGSGFAVGDYWEFTLERAVSGSGVYAQLPGVPITIRVRANVAAAARWPFPVLTGYYEPAGSASIDFRARIIRGNGAGTVTALASCNAGTSPFSLSIEDVGRAV